MIQHSTCHPKHPYKQPLTNPSVQGKKAQHGFLKFHNKLHSQTGSAKQTYFYLGSGPQEIFLMSTGVILVQVLLMQTC